MDKNIEKQIDEILTRGVGEFIDPDNVFKSKLLSNPKDIIIKYGVDPTRPDIHLGHAVCFRKLRELQKLGCKVIFLIGDFTAMLGDPSGKDKVRPMIHLDEVRRNMKTYLDQVNKILLVDKEHFNWITNSDWYVDVVDIEIGENEITNIKIPTFDGQLIEGVMKGPHLLAKAELWDKSRIQNKIPEVAEKNKGVVHSVTLIKFIMGLRHLTHAQIMKRSRFNEREELFMHELMYPVLQGIDSNVLCKIYGRCDLEIGGTDQTFNMLIGRDIMAAEKQPPQSILSLKLLEGTDGEKKMSKSLDNYIGITEEPNQMFGKVMSVPDTSIVNYFELCTDVPLEKIEEIKKGLSLPKNIFEKILLRMGLKKQKINPRDAKLDLAFEIVKIYHGEDEAQKSKDYFVNTFSKKETPVEIKEFKIAESEIKLTEVLVQSGNAKSLSDARRKIEQGGVELNGKKIEDWKMVLNSQNNEAVLKVGKFGFVKIKF